MKRAATGILAALVLAAPSARAQEPEEVPSGDPAVSDPASEPADAPPPGKHGFVGRLGALGAYERLHDLSLVGGGFVLSLGGEGDKVGGHANFHFVDGRTTAGLVVLELGVTGTAEWRIGDGFRAGVGGGWTYFGIQRATDRSWLQSFGPTGLVRLGYDFGDKPGLYLLFDLEGQLQGGGSTVWGPTLETGLRF